MKEYQIEVTSTTTIYVEANNEEEALDKAYEKALWAVPDSNDAVIVNIIDPFEDVIDNGQNIKMRNLTGCLDGKNWTLNDCEEKCNKYYSCYAVAEANDILKEYEDNH